jgi:hypothetical protein
MTLPYIRQHCLMKVMVCCNVSTGKNLPSRFIFLNLMQRTLSRLPDAVRAEAVFYRKSDRARTAAFAEIAYPISGVLPEVF